MSLARRLPALRRFYSSPPPAPPPPPRSQASGHAHFYSDLLPGMLPVALLGSAVYLGLRLAQHTLSDERFLDEARTRVRELEREIDTLLAQQRAADAQSPAASPAPDTLKKKRGWLW